jgi:RNA polymerase sigma factor (sigma-70 family)
VDEPSRRERFETTILVHLDAAHNLARWVLRDDAAAEDVVQDASVRAFRFFDGMQGPTPKAWFMAIVRRTCLDWIGRAKRRGVEESYDDAQHGAAVLDTAGAAESPESLAIRAADIRQLHACLEALPREFREVLILREMEELSYREISAVVGVPIGTVMSRLARGRDQLARRMRAPGTRKRS